MTAVLKSNVADRQPAVSRRDFPVWGMVAVVFAVTIGVAIVQARESTTAAPSSVTMTDVAQPLGIGAVVRVASGKGGDYNVYGAYKLAIHLDAGEQVRVVGRARNPLGGNRWFYQVVPVDLRGRPGDTPVSMADLEIQP